MRRRNPRKKGTPLRRNPFVNAPAVLYHGTEAKHLHNILTKGLLPRADHSEWSSVHRTKTTNATFLTDLPSVAMEYAIQSAGGMLKHARDIIVLEIDPKKVPGEIEPDFDDAASLLEVDLDEIRDDLKGLWEPALGKLIPDAVFRKVERAIEQCNDYASSDRAPFSLDTVIYDGKAYLGARPYVTFSIDRRGPPELYEEAQDVQYIDGEPYLTPQQFLTRGRIPSSAIKSVLVYDPNGPIKLTYYWDILNPEDDDNAAFPVIRFHREVRS